MFSYEDIMKIMERRFGAIPNVEVEDIETWLQSSYAEHGVGVRETLNPGLATLVLLHAEADGTGHVALMTSHYFSFTDKDETVDKSMVSENYRMASEALWKRYNQKRKEGVEGFGGPSMHFMSRIDRTDVDV